MAGPKLFKRGIERVRDTVWLVMRPQMAVEWYRMWKTVPVKDWLRAADLFIRGDYSKAADYYRRGLRARPMHPASTCARMDLAYCCYRLGRLDEAIDLLDLLVGQRVNLRDAYLLRSKLAAIVGCPHDGFEVLGIGVEVFPDDVSILSASLHINLSHQLDARRLHECFSRLLRLKQQLALEDERQVTLETALAHYELRCGDTEAGDRMLARVLATGAAPYEAVLLRGERLLRLGRILSAREQLTRAMRSAPRNPRPVQLLAETYLVAGYTEEPEFAEQLASVACRLSHWENPECVELLARAYERKCDYNSSDLLKARAQSLRSARRVMLAIPLAAGLGTGRYKAAA